MTSVVIPLYNKAKYIERAICSVLNQTLPVQEVLVVDDGSTDGGAQVVEALHDARVRVVTQPNQGVSAARNRGVAHAQGDVVAFLDADDEWLPGFHQAIDDLVKAYPQAGMYATSIRYATDDGWQRYPRYAAIAADPPVSLLERPVRLFAIGPDHPLSASSLVVRKSVFEAAGGFNTASRYGEDEEMWLVLALRAPIAFDCRVQAIYHQQTENSLAQQHVRQRESAVVPLLEQLLRQPDLDMTLRSDLREYHARQLLYMAEVRLHGGDMAQARGMLARVRTELFSAQLHRLQAQSRLPWPVFRMVRKMRVILSKRG